MNEQRRDAHPNSHTHDGEETGAHACDRAEDLVTYFYGEASEAEARSFNEHLSACAVCREDLAAFGDVREAVGTWRAEALRLSPATNLVNSPVSSPVAQPAATAARERSALGERKRSARAALREFFTLSPLWLRAASVAAMLLLCALSVLTLARTGIGWDRDGLSVQTGGVRERIVEKRVEVPARTDEAQTAHTPEQMQALAAERDRLKSELEALKAQRDAATVVAVSAPSKTSQLASRRNAAAGASSAETASANTPRRGRNLRGDLPRSTQVARWDEREEENLPRLSDLLNVVN